MIVIEVTGGLGNQMFGYAFAKALACRTGDKLRISKRIATNDLRAYTLDKYVLHDTAKYMENESTLIRKLYQLKLSFDYRFNHDHTTSSGFNHFCGITDIRDCTTYYHVPYMSHVVNVYRGLFQNPTYFDEYRTVLQDDFQIKDSYNEVEKQLVEQIEQSESVCLHIRRGDFLKSSKHNVCDLDYYQRAVAEMKKQVPNAHFYAFSDDIDWVKEHFRGDEFTFADLQSKDYVEMSVMSQCKHFVIPNSTFSWWAQYLSRNTNKVVIAPSIWLKGEKPMENGIIQKEWICLDP